MSWDDLQANVQNIDSTTEGDYLCIGVTTAKQRLAYQV